MAGPRTEASRDTGIREGLLNGTQGRLKGKAEACGELVEHHSFHRRCGMFKGPETA